MKLKLALHDIYNQGDEIDRALQRVIDEAVAKKAKVVEIIAGKGSGQLKKRVLQYIRFHYRNRFVKGHVQRAVHHPARTHLLRLPTTRPGL